MLKLARLPSLEGHSLTTKFLCVQMETGNLVELAAARQSKVLTFSRGVKIKASNAHQNRFGAHESKQTNRVVKLKIKTDVLVKVWVRLSQLPGHLRAALRHRKAQTCQAAVFGRTFTESIFLQEMETGKVSENRQCLAI